MPHSPVPHIVYFFSFSFFNHFIFFISGLNEAVILDNLALHVLSVVVFLDEVVIKK